MLTRKYATAFIATAALTKSPNARWANWNVFSAAAGLGNGQTGDHFSVVGELEKREAAYISEEILMSVLNKLTMTESTERSKGYDPIRVRRKKLAAALQDQLHLLNAAEAGESYRRLRVQRKRDLETDEVFDVEQLRRVSPWWWVDDDGTVKFSLRYGSARLKVKDGKDVLVVANTGELRKILPALRQETLMGGLDQALAEAADGLQARFKSVKKGKA